MSKAITLAEVRQRAKALLAPHCRVCPQCDGRACVGEVPGMGSLGTGAGFRNNLSALADRRLRVRVIHDVSEPDPRTDLLGLALALPVLAAPIGGVAFNMGGAVGEEAYLEAVLGGCLDQGTLGCTGDGVPAFITDAAFGTIAALGGMAIPFLKPWDSGELEEKLERALATGVRVVGMDLDAAGLVTLRLMGRPVAPKPADVLRTLLRDTPAAFVLKGILTVEDALLAVDVGAAAIVVSNHGGRVLDHAPGAAEVLPAIVEAVAGQIPVLADGGVRAGVDVLKLLALGASAVMVGRPISVAAVGGGREGVGLYLARLRDELLSAMVLTGCRSVAEAGPHLVMT